MYYRDKFLCESGFSGSVIAVFLDLLLQNNFLLLLGSGSVVTHSHIGSVRCLLVYLHKFT